MDIKERLTQKLNHWGRIVLDGSLREHSTSIRRAMAKPNRVQADNPFVFALSTGRVGTQTLTALANLSPNLLAYHEPAPDLHGLSRQAYLHADHEVAHTILNEAVRTARNELWRYSNACEQGYIETSPQATFLAPIIMHILPKAKFIHLVREPKAVIRSGMKRKWYAGHISDSTRIEPLSGSTYFEAWPAYAPFQKNLWLWAETNRWVRDFCKTLPQNQTLTLRSEALFAGDAESVDDFYTFLGSPQPAKKQIDNVLRKRLNRYTQGEFAEDEYWAAETGSELSHFVADIATELGYDLFEPGV